MTRYLVERVSWVCRDYQQEADENCAVKITFSRRGGMSYLSFQDYLRRLRSQNTEIHWPAIDIDAIDAQDHSRVAALQLADAITSGVAAGVEPDKFGNCESRYAEILKRITYRRGENYLSYGFKIVPNIADIDLSDDQRRTVAIFNGGK